MTAAEQPGGVRGPALPPVGGSPVCPKHEIYS